MIVVKVDSFQSLKLPQILHFSDLVSAQIEVLQFGEVLKVLNFDDLLIAPEVELFQLFLGA